MGKNHPILQPVSRECEIPPSYIIFCNFRIEFICQARQPGEIPLHDVISLKWDAIP